MPKGSLDSTKVTDIEKRRSPSKHYVFIIEVRWSDGSSYRIGRRYSVFFDMHMALLERFPVESGQRDPSQRIIPFLPGKNFFARNSRDVTLKRLPSITEYCEALNNLPANISQCDILKRFFEANGDDIERYSKAQSTVESDETSQDIHTITGPLEFDTYMVIADYKAEDKTQVSLKAGENVEVAEKNENGWWLVSNSVGSNGWVPGAYLEKPDGKKEDLVTESAERGKGACYKATCAYEATSSDEISFPIGAVLEILQKNLEGWWLASYKGSEGWVPGSYLEKSSQQCPEINSAEDRDSIGKLPSFGRNAEGFGSKPRLPPKRSTIRRQVPKGGRSQSKTAKNYYVTLYDFTATIEGGLSFREGQNAEVLEQSDNGWWLVEIDGNKGWAPASYLELSNDNKNSTAEISKLGLSSSSSHLLTSSPNRDHASLSPRFPSQNVRPLSTGAPPYTSTGGRRSPSPTPLRNPPTFLGSDSNPATTTNRPGRPVSPAFNKRPPQKHLSEGRKSLPKVPPEKPYQKQEMEASVSWNAKATTETTNKKFDYARPGSSSADSPFGAILSRMSKQSERDSTEQESWYRNISRADAERALKQENKEGYFIVRPSSKKGTENPYSLTLFYRQTIFNFHIRRRSDGLFATGVYSDGEKTFSSVSEMINFYHSNTLVVGDTSNQVKLRGSPK